MNISVNDVNFNSKQELRDYAKSKVEKLYHMYDQIIGIEVIFRLENNTHEDNKTTEIKVKVPGTDLFAKKTAKTFEESTDSSLEALRKQVEKHKDRLK